MNHQEAFDRALSGIRGQGYNKSWDSSRSSCAYRGRNGTKCAIGHLVSDACVTYENNASNLERLLGTSSLANSELQGLDREFLRDLQSAHDRMDSPRHYETQMRHIATKWEIKYVPTYDTYPDFVDPVLLRFQTMDDFTMYQSPMMMNTMFVKETDPIAPPTFPKLSSMKHAPDTCLEYEIFMKKVIKDGPPYDVEYESLYQADRLVCEKMLKKYKEFNPVT